MDLTTTRPNALTTQQIDIGAAFEFARSDPNWMTKYAIHGLVIFIPVVGALAYMGWGRRVYHQVRRGDMGAGLPDLDLGGEISDGIAPFVANLNLMLVMMPLMFLGWIGMFGVSIVGSIVASALGDAGGALVGVMMGLLALLFYAVMFVFIMGANVIMPEIQRRGYNGELGPLFSIGRSFRAIRSNPGQFLMTFLGIFLSGMIGGLGSMLCGVGVVLTLPLGHAMGAHILAQWDSLAERALAGD